MRRHLAILPLLILLPACVWASGDPYVLVTSEPAGATILVDGEESGLTTPATVELDGAFGDDHVITLKKRGYQAEDRTVYHHREGYSSRWIDGVTAIELFAFPTFWTTGDFLFPFGVRWGYAPAELRVVLYAEGSEAPVR